MTAETSASFAMEGIDPRQACTDEVLRQTYDDLRRELVQLEAATLVDDGAVSRVMARLDETQLQMKAGHGLKGNNPRGHKAIPSPEQEWTDRDV